MSITVVNRETWMDFQIRYVEETLAKFKQDQSEINMMRLRSHMRDMSRLFNDTKKGFIDNGT